MSNNIITMAALNDATRISSLEIANVTGKLHKDVMKAIRTMEPVWENERGRKFALSQIQEKIPNGGYKLRPCYLLDKLECLFVATKFNDVARAKLVLRWEELEKAQVRMSKKSQSCGLLETEAEIMSRSDAIMLRKISEANREAEGCFTMSQVARALRMSYHDLCKLLESHDVISRDKGQFTLLPPFTFMGYEAYRYHESYRLDGNRRQKVYMVWTAEGFEFVKGLVKRIKNDNKH